jgi:hypothetical protein
MQNAPVMLFGRTRKCARCGSRHDVKTVTYARRRGEPKVTELWCQRCRRERLFVRQT